MWSCFWSIWTNQPHKSLTHQRLCLYLYCIYSAHWFRVSFVSILFSILFCFWQSLSEYLPAFLHIHWLLIHCKHCPCAILAVDKMLLQLESEANEQLIMQPSQFKTAKINMLTDGKAICAANIISLSLFFGILSFLYKQIWALRICLPYDVLYWHPLVYAWSVYLHF